MDDDERGESTRDNFFMEFRFERWRGGWKRCQKQTRGRGVRLGSDGLLEDTRRKTKKGLGEDGKEKGNGELIDTTCSWSTRTGRPD